MPTLSVILPLFNDQTRVQRCLDSLSSQTLEDIEILIINDSSTDNSVSIAEAHIAKDPRFKLFHSENKGAYACRNLGLRHAKGKYIGFIDSDDWMENNGYESLVTGCETQTTDSSLCSSSRYLEKDGTFSKHFHFDDWPEKIEMNEEYIHKINGGLWNKVYKSENIRRINLKFSAYRIGADLDFNWRYYLSFPKVAIIKKPMYVYTLRNNSIVTKPVGKQSLDIIKVYRDLKFHLIQNRKFKQYKSPFYKIACRRLGERMIVEKKILPLFMFMTVRWLGPEFIIFFAKESLTQITRSFRNHVMKLNKVTNEGE
ncbi:glycosyltransferase family 2 protein [Peredibacter starrii]|uniref:Glycosyltransferase n=1 Tax=Peredibacter starrii TaxID=28202 RepID=A0AAX4HSG3_9BACT|nr:glycosyltransferase [Peredibacter starrii]WPU65844.1 glycosyltransferase [Peredibacter starrii]